MSRPLEKNGFVACVGLDRILWVFDMKTRSSLAKVHCKTKMTSVLIIDDTMNSPEVASVGKRKKGAESASVTASDDEGELVWSKMREVSDTGGVRKKRIRARV